LSATLVKRFSVTGSNSTDLIQSQIVDHFYVGNWLASFRSVEEAMRITEALDMVLMRAGFPLVQWCSTDEETLSAICSRITEPADVDLDAAPVERNLGLSWDSGTDDFVAHFNVG
ncbi:hypothetical protein M514_06531, partial [Trichuris suis]